MSELKFLLRTSWDEFRSGVSSGIVTFTFIGLSLYLALTLLNAEYLQQLGATNVTRNAATVIYLMVTGFMFFLFFAYAWIFAQPVLRDRSANLNEIMLTMPVSIKTLLWGRFIGACLTGTVLASSILFGFSIASVLAWFGLFPAGSFSATPWSLYAFSLVWIIIPTCVGIGAIYMMMTMLTRSLAGPMGAAVILVLLWMLSAAILVEGDINPTLASILDPSVFSFALAETQSWTPTQKQSAFLPLSEIFLFNRVLWGLLPLIALAVALQRVTREHLISNNDKKSTAPSIKLNSKAPKTVNTLPSLPTLNWLHAFFYECRWQLEQVIYNRVIWVAMLILLCVGISNTFIHVIWHAQGPLLPDPGMTQTALGKSLHLVIFFIIGGVVGLMCRRDHVEGIDDMLDASCTPSILKIAARAVAVVLITTLLSITPAFSAIIVTLITDPNYLNISFAFGMQLLVVLPTQIECAMVVFLVHALIRRTGLAYGASMFVIVILIANHELALINYPPFELGIPARIAFSSLTGWAPILDYVLLLGFFKWMLCLTLFSVAVIFLPRGKDNRWNSFKRFSPRKLMSAPALVALIAVLGTSSALSVLNDQLIEKGGYKTVETERIDNAKWENIWRNQAEQIGFTLQGGNLALRVNTEQGYVEGRWQLNQLNVSNGVLYAQAPDGMTQFVAQLNDKPLSVTIEQDLISVPLKSCTESACSLTLQWKTQQQGWSTTATIPWITTEGIWAHAALFAPTLGIDPDRIIRSKFHRERLDLPQDYTLPSWQGASSIEGIAPSANWQWQVELVNDNALYQISTPLKGETVGPLQVLISGGKKLQKEQVEHLSLWSTPQDRHLNKTIAQDVLDMQRCVERRLQTSIDVTQVVRTPGDGHSSQFANSVLHLSEDPYWHIAAEGDGHLIRRADIAQILARQHIIKAYPLRKSSGSLILSAGLSGAIGLLCVGDTNGIKALASVTKHFAETTTHAISSSTVPVKELKYALSTGWATHYSKLALLAWAAEQSPAEMSLALAKLSIDYDFNDALDKMFGQNLAHALLGLPFSASFELEKKNGVPAVVGKRHQWLNGGWEKTNTDIVAHQLIIDSTGVQLSNPNKFPLLGKDTDNSSMLIIDQLPAYQPSGLSIK